MLRQTQIAFSLQRITLETDRDAVEFYQRCGFQVKSIGEKYPGVERFLCELMLER